MNIILAAIALVGAGILALTALRLGAVAVREFRFMHYRAAVRAVWRREVAAEDIVAQTGEDCWWAAFDDGISPEEAVARGYARI